MGASAFLYIGGFDASRLDLRRMPSTFSSNRSA
jgi:hypothetical protein